MPDIISDGEEEDFETVFATDTFYYISTPEPPRHPDPDYDVTHRPQATLGTVSTASLDTLKGFNVGDRVELVSLYDEDVDLLVDTGSSSDLDYGMQGTIASISSTNSHPFHVRFDKEKFGGHIYCHLSEKEIMLIYLNKEDADWEI